MKLFQNVLELPHPFSITTIANWRKYPNDHSRQVIAVDVLDRTINQQTNVLRTERLLTCRQNVPWIIKKLGLPIPELTYVREISDLDLNTMTYTARSVNLSLRNLITVEEMCIIRPSPSSPSTASEFTQSAKITALGCISTMARLVEEAAVNRFKANATLGHLGLQQICDNVVAEAKELVDEAEKLVDEAKGKVDHAFKDAFAREYMSFENRRDSRRSI
ncbi:hypothetical protein SmJEL517_g04405 [Synchytrium microbalum]|uniref:PRELI/MSF1 domain-containing protein n=1 Tax=Synchytrium microbalum TaxID=1806994 RepID=A0A507BZG1_9FUNG|nr:uncharacterized protein SmJEL517_g04405 [Synchytrium microbalum]TPX32498.1 hypothetical protein SmJEL517_g04405 [Synchytrium microbalum]